MGIKRRERTVRADFVAALEQWPPFRALHQADRLEAAAMIWNDSAKVRTHEVVPGATSYAYQDLNARFGRNRFRQINAVARLFEVKPWSKTCGRTRAFILAPIYREFKQQYLRSIVEKRRRSQLIDMHGHQVRTPAAAIASKRRDGRTALLWRGVNLCPQVPVDIEHLTAHYYALQSQLAQIAGSESTGIGASQHEYDRLVRHQDATAMLLALALIDGQDIGTLRMRYVEAPSGRLYATGFNLQNAPREVRYAALHGTWDVDLSNAHFTLLADLAGRNGFACPAIRHYLDHKASVRQVLANMLEADVDVIKACLLGLIYDAPRSSSPYAAFGRQLGPKRAATLLAFPLFRELSDEVRAAGKHLVASWPVSNRSLINHAGCGISHAAPHKTKLAHLLHGAEALILKTAVLHLEQHRPGDVLLLQHDGVTVAQQPDTTALSVQVQRQTGFAVTFHVEPVRHRESTSPHQEILR